MATATQAKAPPIRVVEVSKQERTRVFVPGNGYQRGFWSSTVATHLGKPRLYVSVQGESFGESFAYRTTRPIALYRTVLAEAFKHLGLPEGTKANWSAKAGCTMCPCSPGFILTLSGGHNFNFGSNKPWDAWVTITTDEDDSALKLREITPEVVYRAERIVAIMEGKL